MAKAPFMLDVIQHGLEGTPGTAVPATFKHFGNGTLKFGESIQQAGFEYARGFAGGVVESTFIADTESVLTLSDSPFSAEHMIWLGNMGIKTVVGAATSFAFTYPTTAANTIGSFTWELATAIQEYEFAYGVCTDFSIHGDVGANNGVVMCNSKHQGRASSASTVTAGLGLLAGLEPLNMNNATLKLDAVGTAAGTASAVAAILRAFSLDCVTGWELRRYADGRATKDGSVAVYKNYELKGKMNFDLDTATLTRIANARAATPEIAMVTLSGSGNRVVAIALPISWSDVGELGANIDGLVAMELGFRAGYSTTTTAQGPSITVTAAGSTTVT